VCCCEQGNTFLVPFNSRYFFNESATVSLSKWAAIHVVGCSEMSSPRE